MGKPAIFSMTTFPFPMEEPAGEGLCSAVKEVLDILTASHLLTNSSTILITAIISAFHTETLDYW